MMRGIFRSVSLARWGDQCTSHNVTQSHDARHDTTTNALLPVPAYSVRPLALRHAATHCTKRSTLLSMSPTSSERSSTMQPAS